MIIKYKLSDLANDLNVDAYEIIALLSKYSIDDKKTGSTLNEEELNIVFEHFTKKSSLKTLDAYFEEGEKHERKDKVHHVIQKAEKSHAEVSPKKEPFTNEFVFISYSTKEADVAEQTRKVLETNGINCWMAPQSIPAGSDYGMEIPHAIATCKFLILILSKASQESNWVPKEVGLAIGKGKIVIPFQIDNADISDSFNFYLTNSQRISAYNRMTDAYQELVNRALDILS